MHLLFISTQAGEGGDIDGVVHRPTGQVVKGDVWLADRDEVRPQSSNSQLARTCQ